MSTVAVLSPPKSPRLLKGVAHSQFRKYVAQFATDSRVFDPVSRAAMENHLRCCSECRSEYDEIKNTQE